MKIDNIAINNAYMVVGRAECETKKNNQPHSEINFKANLKNPDKLMDSFLQNKYTKKVLNFANMNPFGFTIGNLVLTCMLMRPVTTLVVPGSSKEDREYLAGKSFISSAIANGFRLALCLPLANAVKKLGEESAKNPKASAFPAKGTKKFDVLNYGINNGFAVVLGFFTSALMVYSVGKIMHNVEADKAKKKQQKEVANGN